MAISREKIIFVFLLGMLTLAFYREQSVIVIPHAAEAKTVVVSPQATSTVLYFSGIVKPLLIYSVTSPIESVVTKKHFDYGQQIKKGDVLLVLNSNQLRQDYQTALAEYLKAKEHYSINQTQTEGIEELSRLGIISKNEYTTTKSNFNDAALSYSQARQKLLDILQKVQGSQDTITHLQLADYAAVNKALTAGIKDIEIKAPATGVALLPEKGSGSSSDDSGGQKLDIGSQIKSGQRLLALGDMTGIEVEIKVNEVDINRIKPGQDVIVTGAAFPDIELQGKVKSVDVQAVSEGSALPTFPVKIIVPKLTDQQRKIIHVGMSTKVELRLEQPSNVMIPLGAVAQKNGKAVVKVIDSKTDKTTEVEVNTGQTTATAVEVRDGLHAGEKIVVTD